MFAVQGILAALYERNRSGRGQEIDIALTESCLAVMESAVAEYDRLGKVRGRTGTRIPGVVPSNVFKTQDGRWLIIAASQARMFERLCKVMGLPQLCRDDRFATQESRSANQEALEAIIADWVSCHRSDELNEILEKAEIAAGPVYSVADMLGDVQFEARKAFVAHHDPVVGDFLAQGVTPRFSRTPGAVRWSGPWQAGLHNQDVYGGLLGLGDSDLEALRRDGTI